MKSLYLFVLICFVQQHCSGAADTDPPDLSQLSVACIALPELFQVTGYACSDQKNTTLWKKIVKCHRPMTDKFLRLSSEARCAVNLHVDPFDWRVKMHEVFLNICAITSATTEADLNRGLNCMLNGNPNACPRIMSNKEEVEAIKQFGESTDCDVGKCIKKLNIRPPPSPSTGK